MKKNLVKISAIVFLMVSGNQLFANTESSLTAIEIVSDSTTESFKVYGNCGMCKRTIEGSLKDEKGIYSANWDKDTKMMVVQFDESLISLEKIKTKISSVGYDTQEKRATEERYKSLPGCCQYERPEKIMDNK